MINIHLDKKLNIILPNTNKALRKVLTDISTKEFESISSGKDLKSIMSSLLKESSQNSSADKALLKLVKDNPTLKDLGSASQNLKELIVSVKNDKQLSHVEKLLEKFIPKMQDVKTNNVKTTLENSGVFLESKLKNIKEPQTKLKNLLEKLDSSLQKSTLPSVKTIKMKLHEILKSIPNTPQTKESPKVQETLVKSTQELVKSVSKELKSADPITTKDFTQKLAKLEHLLEPKNLEKTNFKAEKLHDSLKEVIDTLKTSYTKQSAKTTINLDSILKKITPKTTKDLPNNLVKDLPKAIQEVSKNIQDIKQNINTQTTKDLPLQTLKEVLPKLEKLQINLQTNITQKKEIKLPQVQESLKQIVMSTQEIAPKELKTVVDLLSKIFKPLQNIQETEVSMDKKTPIEIKNIVQDLKTHIAKADPIYSSNVKEVLKDLSLLNAPAKLSNEQNIKEILNNDLKAVLHKVSDEVSKLQTPTQAEVLKHIDKLTLQIDYYQLVSHLSNSSSLYVPYSWEQMQDGEISMKHSKDDKFYCDIDLKLKDYGELNLRLTLYDKNQLNINIHSDNDEFKEIMKEAIPELRKALIDVSITPREIRLHEKTKKQATISVYDEISQDLDAGFEVIG